MSAMASQITSLVIIYSTVHWGAYQRKRQSSASLAFVRPVTREMFPFDSVIMQYMFFSTATDTAITNVSIPNKNWLEIMEMFMQSRIYDLFDPVIQLSLQGSISDFSD